MRNIARLPEPQILIDKKVIWLQNFLASGKARPDSSKYAHAQVRASLIAMSWHKCFYCETKLKDKPIEVDHHVEVSVNKDLAFEWTNLYLACDNCNGKIPENAISITDALDPCRDSDATIQEHLTFNSEIIQPRNNSEKGLKTIQKYRLDTVLLDHRRLKQLKLLLDLIIAIQKRQIKDQNSITQDEINSIKSFKRKDNPFSLMFTILLDNLGY